LKNQSIRRAIDKINQMQEVVELSLLPRENETESIKQVVAQKLGIPSLAISHLATERRSLDARRSPVKYRLRVRVWVNEVFTPQSPYDLKLRHVASAPEIHIVGAGPAGLFAALTCIQQGYKPVLLERGKPVRARRRDLAVLMKKGAVNPDSNYCFGEGGAGTFSDGKLYTRSTKRGNIQDIYQTLVYFGAPQDILIDAQPHIGTNKLPGIIERMRNEIIACGGEIHFNARVTDFRLAGDKLTHLTINHNECISLSQLILATGHSARDIFKLLHDKQIAIEAKPIALGLRVEHPQELIDSLQYHQPAPRNPHLPAAAYKWVKQVNDRGVYSFCMCPGGIICPAATCEGEVVVNGWSPSKRNSPFANSGIVVQIDLADLKVDPYADPLGVMYWQKQIEEHANEMGGGKQTAPAQRMTDFIQGRVSSSLPITSYVPGLSSQPLTELLPTYISQKLCRGLQLAGKQLKGYLTHNAVLVGVESRTSSPVRIPRDADTLTHPQIENLLPCGEGAGYAGGIVSAALDGIRCAVAATRSPTH